MKDDVMKSTVTVVLAIALQTAAIASAAHATPKAPPAAASFRASSEPEARIRRVEYQEDLVVSIVGFADHPFVLELSSDEEIRDVAGGGLVSGQDLKAGVLGGWETNRRGSRLFIRPLPSARRTTLLITSSKGRVYVVDLVPGSTARKDFDRRASRVVYTYAPPPLPALLSVALPPTSSAAVLPTLPAANENAPGAAGAATPPPVLRNTNYSMEVVNTAADIGPTEVFDDGRFTYFRFPGNSPIPAIYKSVPNTEKEWLVNSHREGDLIVLHGVARLWNLRIDDGLVGIFNDAFDALGSPAVDGTTMPTWKRGAVK